MASKLVDRSRRGQLVERHWAMRPDALGGRSAKRGFNYRAYVPARIADEDFLLTSQIAAAAADAELACRELNDDSPALASLVPSVLNARQRISSLCPRRTCPTFAPTASDQR